MKAKSIFYSALDLCGLRNEEGEMQSSCGDMQQRAPALINMIATAYHYIDRAILGTDGAPFVPIDTLEDDVGLSDELCTAVMPYLLAAMLIDDEDAALASVFRREAYSLLAEIRRGNAKAHPIKEVY